VGFGRISLKSLGYILDIHDAAWHHCSKLWIPLLITREAQLAMCEIILIVVLAKKIAAKASANCRASAGYVVLFVLAWFGCEFIGGLFGVIINNGEADMSTYGLALVGAAIGAGSVFTLVSLLPPLEDNEYDRSRRNWDEADYEGERRSRGGAYAGDESYREKFQPGQNRDVEDQPEESDPETGYRQKPGTGGE
jgi:hypothetical protein